MVRYHHQQQRKKLQYNYPVSSNASSSNGRHSTTSCFSPRSCGYFILLFFLGAILYNGIGNTFQYSTTPSEFSLLKVDETKTNKKIDEIKVKHTTTSLDTTLNEKESKKQSLDNTSNKKVEQAPINHDTQKESGDETNYNENPVDIEYKRDGEDYDNYSKDTERSDTHPGNEQHGVNDDEEYKEYKNGEDYKYEEAKDKLSDEENEGNLDEETNNHYQQKMMDDDDVRINHDTEVISSIKNEYVTIDTEEDNNKELENIENNDGELNNKFVDKNIVNDYNAPSADLKEEQKLSPLDYDVIDYSHLNLEKDIIAEGEDDDTNEKTGEIGMNADSQDIFEALLEEENDDEDDDEKDEEEKTNAHSADESLNLDKVEEVDRSGSNVTVNQPEDEEEDNEETGVIEINADLQGIQAELLDEENNDDVDDDDDADEKEEGKANALSVDGFLNLDKVVGSGINVTMNQLEDEDDDNEETGEIGKNADKQDVELLDEKNDDEDDDEKEEDRTNGLNTDGSLYLDKVVVVDVSVSNATMNQQEDNIEEKISNVESEIKLNSSANDTRYDGYSKEIEKNEKVREDEEQPDGLLEEIEEQLEEEQKDEDDESEDEERDDEGKQGGSEKEEKPASKDKVKGKSKEIENHAEEENGENGKKDKDDHDHDESESKETDDEGKHGGGGGEKEKGLASKGKKNSENREEKKLKLRKKIRDKAIFSNISDEGEMQNLTLGEPLSLELQEKDTLNVTDNKDVQGRETLNETDDKNDVGLISEVSNYTKLNVTFSLEDIGKNDLAPIQLRYETMEANLLQGSLQSDEAPSTVTKDKKLRKPSKLTSNLENRAPKVLKDVNDSDCLFRNSPLYRKIFVYPTPGELNAWEGKILSEAGQSYLQGNSSSSFQQWPWVELDRRARESSSGHYDINETNVQYTTELLVRELMIHPKSCLRTYNPNDADLFYVPYLPSTEYHRGINDLNKLEYSNSSYAQAILNIMDKNDYTEWENLFGLTSKYWKRRNGTDHILVFSEPLHGLSHPSDQRGNYHYINTQKQLGTPIIISVELSTTFVSMFPKCALKNILVPYPNTVGSWYNGVERGKAYNLILDISNNLTATSSSAAMPAERYLYEQHQLISSLLNNNSFSFMSLTKVPRPIGQYYKVGHHGGCDDMRKALNESYEMCSQSNKVLIANSINQHRDYAIGMRLSTFCPCPGGDSPSTKRMFDAVVSGCIPVVLSHDFVWPFSTEFDTRTNKHSEYVQLLNPNDFSVRLNASEYKEQLLDMNTCKPLDAKKPGLDEVLSSIPADEIVRLRKNLRYVAESYYSWYKPRADLPDNPLKDGILPDGGIAHMIVKSLVERAKGRLYPACDEELQQIKQGKSPLPNITMFVC